MTLFGFLILLLIAAFCGGIGKAIAGYEVGWLCQLLSDLSELMVGKTNGAA